MLLIVSCLRNRPSETQPCGFFPLPSKNLTPLALAEMSRFTRPVCDFPVATFEKGYSNRTLTLRVNTNRKLSNNNSLSFTEWFQCEIYVYISNGYLALYNVSFFLCLFFCLLPFFFSFYWLLFNIFALNLLLGTFTRIKYLISQRRFSPL